MTKSEYMRLLQEKLEHFSSELQEEIMEDYRQHFIEGELQGKTDAEIIQELGKIEDMVRDLSETGARESIRRQNPCPPENGPETTILEGDISSQCTSNQNIPNQCTSNSEGEQTFTYSRNYEAVSIDEMHGDLFLEKSPDDQIHVTYVNGSQRGQTAYEYYQYEEYNVFHTGIRQKKNVSFSPREDGPLSLTLSVKIPDFVKSLRVKSSSGDIQIHHLALDEMQLENSNGNVTLCDTQCQALLGIHSSVGNIHLEGTDADQLDLQTSAGDIHLKNLQADQSKIQTSSGNICLESLNADRVELETSCGDITAANAASASLKIHTQNGDISMSDVTCKQTEIQSNGGDVNLCDVCSSLIGICSDNGDVHLDDLTAKRLELQTSNGDVLLEHLTAERLKTMTSLGDIRLENLSADGLELQTASGDISVSGTKWNHIDAISDGGDITLQDDGTYLGGSCKCTTDSGDISVRSGAGKYECQAQNGDISINAAGTPKELHLRSLNGDIHVNAAGTPDLLDLSSDNGDIQLHMPETQGMEVTLNTSGGDSEILWGGKRTTLNRGTCVFGNGASKVNARSNMGDICISDSR